MNNPPNTPETEKSRLPVPSARLTAALAAAMLAIGVGVGAAIGPAPATSVAGPANLPALLATLAARQARSAPAAASPAPAATQAAAEPVRHRRRRHRKAAESAATSEAPATEAATTPASSTTKPASTKKAELPPASKVWLIQLGGSTFTEALAHPSSAPYISTQALPAGTLLSGWSSLQGSAFATDAALIAGPSPQLIDTIVQPPCPEGAAAAACATGTPGALSAADEFLKTTIPTITSLSSFRENGLIVVTFASIASATATGLPAGASTSTLTAEPPAGVLLISPFVGVGARSTVSFSPTSPQQALEKLLRK